MKLLNEVDSKIFLDRVLSSEETNLSHHIDCVTYWKAPIISFTQRNMYLDWAFIKIPFVKKNVQIYNYIYLYFSKNKFAIALDIDFYWNYW